MRKISTLATISVLLGLGALAYGAESVTELQASDEKAYVDIGQGCTAKLIDQKKYDSAIASGLSAEDAELNAVVLKSFSQRKFDMALASGASNADAQKFAAVFAYADNTPFCVQYRLVLQSREAGK